MSIPNSINVCLSLTPVYSFAWLLSVNSWGLARGLEPSPRFVILVLCAVGLR